MVQGCQKQRQEVSHQRPLHRIITLPSPPCVLACGQAMLRPDPDGLFDNLRSPVLSLRDAIRVLGRRHEAHRPTTRPVLPPVPRTPGSWTRHWSQGDAVLPKGNRLCTRGSASCLPALMFAPALCSSCMHVARRQPPLLRHQPHIATHRRHPYRIHSARPVPQPTGIQGPPCTARLRDHHTTRAGFGEIRGPHTHTHTGRKEKRS